MRLFVVVGDGHEKDTALIDCALALAAQPADLVCDGLGDAASAVDRCLGAAVAKGASAVRVWAPAIEVVDYLGHALVLARAILRAATLPEPAVAADSAGDWGEHEFDGQGEGHSAEQTRPRFMAPGEVGRPSAGRTWQQAPPNDALVLSGDPVIGPAVAELLGVPHWGRVRRVARHGATLVVERSGSREPAGWSPPLPALLVVARASDQPLLTTDTGFTVNSTALEALDLAPMDLLHRRHFRLRKAAIPVAPAAHFSDAAALVARLLADGALEPMALPLAGSPPDADRKKES